MLLRQVQARPVQGHHLRALRRRGHALEGAPRAHGSHRARRAGHAHLVLQGRPEPARLPARHRAEEPREGHLLRRAPHHLGRRRAAAQGPAAARGRHPGRDRATSRSERELELRERDEEYEDELAELEGRERARRTSSSAPRRRGTRTSRSIRARGEAEIEHLKHVWDTFRGLAPKQLVDDERVWRELSDRYQEYFAGGMGAEAVKDLISRLDLERRGGRASRRSSPPPRASARRRRSSA